MIAPNTLDPVSQTAVDEEFFDKYAVEWINHDIEAAICGKANYLAALGLLCYTEYLGGFVTGNGAKDREAKANFKAFLPYLGQDYKDFDGAHNAYDLWRCGLAHEYFGKKKSSVAMWGSGSGIGLQRERGGTYLFVVVTYFMDFKAGVQRFRTELFGTTPNQALLANFKKVRERRWV